jgi:hypothetical protein
MSQVGAFLVVILIAGCASSATIGPTDNAQPSVSGVPTLRVSPSATTSRTITSSRGLGTFLVTGSMIGIQDIHSATLLLDGRVLIAGGVDAFDVVASAELYDPQAQRFVGTGSLASARAFETATLLSDGRVLMAGGDGASSILGSAELYDPTLGTFSPTGSLGHARELATSTRLADGRVLIVGGVDGQGNYLSSAELYDPATSKFTSTGSMKIGREGQTATLLRNGDVLIAGGDHDLDSPQELAAVFASAEVYDPVTGKFTATGSMNVVRSRASATILPDGRVLIDGGEDVNSASLASCEIYDPITGKFTLTAAMAVGRADAMVATLTDGRVLVAGGGTNCNANRCDGLRSAELFDPAEGKFNAVGSMNDPRWGGYASATLLQDGQVLIAGDAGTAAELYVP